MSQERWQQIRRIVEAAVDTPPDDREQFVRSECRTDTDLYEDVVSILWEYNATSVLDGSPYEVLADANCGDEVGGEPAASHQDLAETLVHMRLKDRYVLERELGRGGFGMVFLATDERLVDKKVVIKVMLLPALDDWKQKRFRTEIQALARLNHPGIVSVSDTGEIEDGRLFIVMEYVEGVPLRSLIRGGGVDLRMAAEVVRQVGRALETAHKNGIWHRDLKPENIMVQSLEDGEWNVKLIDFGIATVTSEETGASRNSRVAGTIRYMAPEQLSGDPSAASDLYALGVIAYEMITGTTPFDSDNAVRLHALQEAGLRERPRQFRPELPEEAEAAILRALEFQEQNRYSSTSEFVNGFLKAVRRTGSGDIEGVAAIRAAITPAAGSENRHFERELPRRRLLQAAWAAGAGCAIAGGWFASRKGNPARPATSIVVLPLEDISHNKDDEYLADAMTDELIETLTKSDLRVVARASAFRLRGTAFDPRQIGERLGVDTLLTGTLRRQGDKIRISLQLVHAQTGFGIWARSFEQTAGQTLEASAAICLKVTEALKAKLVPPNEGRAAGQRAANWQAHNAYAQGRFFANRRTIPSIQMAISYYEQALKLNPDYAAAYSGLADAYIYLGILQPATPEQVVRIKELAQRANHLDDSLAEPYTTLGQIAHFYDWDAAAAESDFRLAVDRDAASSDARRQYGGLLMNLRRTKESRAELDAALDFDPISVLLQLSRAFVDYLDGLLDAAEQRTARIIESDPGIPHTYQLAGILKLKRGRSQDAVTDFRRSVEVSHDNLAFRAFHGYSLGVAGQMSEARAVLNRILAEARSQRVDPSDIATVYAGLAEDAAALDWLDKAVAARSPGLVQLLIRPTWERLRTQPRFAEIARRVTLFRGIKTV